MAENASTPVFPARTLVLCVGPGGVGKTTCAAALALTAARDGSGRKVAVVTIDPSRRLAQALGLEDKPTGELVAVLEPGRDGGHLDALILDGASVFDTIVRTCASDRETIDRILASRMYQATARRLSGALEFAAMARVQMLVDAGRHDLIVLDTPPTANAMDFLEAPRRVRELISNPGARLLAGTGRIGSKILGLGGAVFSKTLERMGGGAFIGDLGAFLREFATVLEEFQRRGGDFEQFLRSEATGVLVVTTASTFSVREANAFLDQLADYGLHIDAAVLNRADPPLPAAPEREIFDAAAAARGYEAQTIERMWAAYAGSVALGERSQRSIAALRDAHPDLRVWPALRRGDPPDSVPELMAFGRAIFG